MAQAIISRRGGGYATITFNGVSALKRTGVSALSVARARLAATTVGTYALFGGGATSSDILSTVNAYNTSLTKSTPTALSQAREELAATTVGNYALFGGGIVSKTVDAYDTSLTRSTPTALSQSRHDLAATTVDRKSTRLNSSH